MKEERRGRKSTEFSGTAGEDHLEAVGKHSAMVFECLFCACSSRLCAGEWDALRGGTGGTHAGARVVNNYIAAASEGGRDGRRRVLTKVCLQVAQMMFFAASFVLFWLLAAPPAFAWLRSRFCWAFAPCD